MRILIVSDAWEPQVNGVVRTLQAMQRELTAMGHVVGFITPDQYRSLPCPTYPEIRLAMAWPSSVGAAIAALFHIIHAPFGYALRAARDSAVR